VLAGGCTWCATAPASSSACTRCCSRTASRAPSPDLFGARGRQLLAQLGLPVPWQGTIEANLRLIDELDREIAGCERELRRLGADHRYVPLLLTVPGISWVLAYTIAAEIGDISRFASPRRLAGYSGLCPRVYQSGERDLRGPLAKQGPAICAGRWSRLPPTPAPLPSTASATSERKRVSANSAAPRSPRSTSPAGSPKRSGTCSPTTNPSLRQAPSTPWPPDGP
jgi:transposase